MKLIEFINKNSSRPTIIVLKHIVSINLIESDNFYAVNITLINNWSMNTDFDSIEKTLDYYDTLHNLLKNFKD
jgi:hypothetical protein